MLRTGDLGVPANPSDRYEYCLPVQWCIVLVMCSVRYSVICFSALQEHTHIDCTCTHSMFLSHIQNVHKIENVLYVAIYYVNKYLSIEKHCVLMQCEMNENILTRKFITRIYITGTKKSELRCTKCTYVQHTLTCALDTRISYTHTHSFYSHAHTLTHLHTHTLYMYTHTQVSLSRANLQSRWEAS